MDLRKHWRSDEVDGTVPCGARPRGSPHPPHAGEGPDRTRRLDATPEIDAAGAARRAGGVDAFMDFAHHRPGRIEPDAATRRRPISTTGDGQARRGPRRQYRQRTGVVV